MHGFWKGDTITNAFQKMLGKSRLKPKKNGWIKIVNFTTDQLSHISQDNIIEMYSTHNEEKFVVSEMFT